ncbi:MAG: hypothetical protein ACQEQG_07690 [Bacillota bacterium]
MMFKIQVVPGSDEKKKASETAVKVKNDRISESENLELLSNFQESYLGLVI